MSSRHQRRQCPRLLDYVVLVGPDSQAIVSGSDPAYTRPRLLRRYPPLDHADFCLPPDIVHFCQPTASWPTASGRSFAFTLTEKDSGIVRHGACLAFSVGSPPRPLSLCAVAHHAFYAKLTECLRVLRAIVDGFGDSVWPLLTGWLAPDSAREPALSNARSVETWILRLLSAPAPVPGVSKLQLSVLPESLYSPLLLALPDRSRLPLADFALHTPLLRLGAPLCLSLLATLLLENKVALQAADPGCLSVSVLALVALLYPLQYVFPVIPLLPAGMTGAEQLLLAPTPYLIGLPSGFLSRRPGFRLPAEVVLVELDSGKVTSGASSLCQLSSLPEQEQKLLCKQLNQYLDALTSMRESQSQPIANLDSLVAAPSGQLPPPPPPPTSMRHQLVFGNDIDSVDVGIRISTAQFFASPALLGNAAEHSRCLRARPRPVVAFQCRAFLRSRPRRAVSQFTDALARTQAIECLAEWCHSPDNLAYERIGTGLRDPATVGDKAKWFSRDLRRVCHDCCDGEGAAARFQPVWPTADPSAELEAGPAAASSGAAPPLPLDRSLADGDHGGGLAVLNSAEFSAAFQPPKLPPLPTIDGEDGEGDCVYNSGDADSISQSGDGGSSSEFSGESGDDEVDEGLGDCMSNSQLSHSMSTLTARSARSAIAGQPPSSSDSVTDSGLSATIGGVSRSSVGIAGPQFSRSGSVRYSSTSDLSSLRSQVRYSHDDSSLGGRSHGSGFLSEISESLGNRAGARIGEVLAHQTAVRRGRPPATVTGAGLEEEQRFLREVASGVLAGQGVGFITKSLRLNSLMCQERCRALLLALLRQRPPNSAAAAAASDAVGAARLADVPLRPSVFRGLLDVLRAVVAGLTSQYSSSNGSGGSGSDGGGGGGGGGGGVASAMLLLEIAYTHYCETRQKSDSSFDDRQARDWDSSSFMSTFTDWFKEIRRDSETAGASRRASQVSGSSVVLNGEEYENIEVQQQQQQQQRKSDPMREMLSQKMSGRGSASQGGGGGGHRGATASNASSSLSAASALRIGGGSVFLYERLLGKDRSLLWDSADFWEDLFLDWVANEREVLSLDCGSFDRRRRRQELYEDRLLGRALHNTAAFMLAMGVDRVELCRRIRRLLARSHVGLHHSRKIGRLLDSLPPAPTGGNIVRLRCPLSRLPRRPSFDARLMPPTSETATSKPETFSRLCEVRYLEISDHCLALRCRSGAALRRVWFDSLASVTFDPANRRLLLLTEAEDEAAAAASVPLALRCRRGRRVCRCIRDRVVRRAAADSSSNGVVGCRLRIGPDHVLLQLQSERASKFVAPNSP